MNARLTASVRYRRCLISLQRHATIEAHKRCLERKRVDFGVDDDHNHFRSI